MSTTEDERQDPGPASATGVEPVDPAGLALAAERARRRAEVRDRLILPLVIPLGAIVVVLFYVLNVSGVFLSSKTHTPAIIAGTLITVGILAGAALISAMPRARTGSLTMFLAGLGIVLLMAGLATLGARQEKKEGAVGGYRAPTGPAMSSLSVDALATIKFQAKDFTVPPGVIQVRYNDLGGTHTLDFDKPQLSGFELDVPGGPTQGKVDLASGDYTIFCNIPGHRQLGMEATVHVVAGAQSSSSIPGFQPAAPPAAGGATAKAG